MPCVFLEDDPAQSMFGHGDIYSGKVWISQYTITSNDSSAIHTHNNYRNSFKAIARNERQQNKAKEKENAKPIYYSLIFNSISFNYILTIFDVFCVVSAHAERCCVSHFQSSHRFEFGFFIRRLSFRLYAGTYTTQSDECENSYGVVPVAHTTCHMTDHFPR